MRGCSITWLVFKVRDFAIWVQIPATPFLPFITKIFLYAQVQKVVMGLKGILDSLSKEDGEKGMQKKTDAILGFIFETIGKGARDTYFWIKDGVEIVRDNYRQWHDEKLFRKMFREKEENGANFCKPTYKWGPTVCFNSRYFHDKSFMKYFCNQEGCGPDLYSVVKRHNAKHTYCGCSPNSRKERKETLINTN